MAYSSFARDAYGALIPAFQQSAGRPGHDVLAVLRRLRAPRARAVIAGLPADVVNLSLVRPTSTAWSRPVSCPRELEQEPVPRHGHELDHVWVFIVRKGNPEHRRSGGRPGQA